MSNIEEYTEKIFEDIKRIDERGNEYWYARELQDVLEYKRWDKFCNVIENAKIACEKSNYKIEDHFSQVGRMVEIGSKTSRTIMDFELSRYACLQSNNNVNCNFGVNTKIVSVGSITKSIIDYKLSRYAYYLVA